MKVRTLSKLEAALLVVPVGLGLGGSGASAMGARASHATTHKYAGDPVDMRYGTVQVTLYVKSKRITNVKTVYDVHAGRSEFITGEALPILRTEVLQAQSAQIDAVSRATDTSQAFVESLQSAIDNARKHKALK